MFSLIEYTSNLTLLSSSGIISPLMSMSSSSTQSPNSTFSVKVITAMNPCYLCTVLRSGLTLPTSGWHVLVIFNTPIMCSIKKILDAKWPKTCDVTFLVTLPPLSQNCHNFMTHTHTPSFNRDIICGRRLTVYLTRERPTRRIKK